MKNLKLKKRGNMIYIGIYVLLLYAISAFVFLNGDDFMYGTFSKEGILQNVISYYYSGNGRLWINILDSLLLTFDRYLFIIICPLVILSFIFLLAKNIQWLTEKKDDRDGEQKYVRYSMVLFACLDVLCFRETVFWITGMMNYLFPATIFLLGLLMFQKAHLQEDFSLTKKLLYCLLCFLIGFSVEQYALMFVGIMTLVFAVDLLQKRKPASLLLVGYIIALIGLAVLILAPGNFVRVDTQALEKPPFIDNLWTLIYQNSVSEVAFPLLLMLSMCANVIIAKNCQSKFIRTIAYLIPVLLLAIRCISFLEKAVLVVILLFFILIQLVYVFVIKSYAEKTMILSLIFVGIGSQVMLLISAVWGFRCMFSMYMVYMLLILFCFKKIDDENKMIILCSGIIGSIKPVAVVLLWVVFLILRRRKSLVLSAEKVLTCVAVIVSLSLLIFGYAHNSSGHLENIESTKKAEDSGELVLNELYDDTYSWYFIPMNEFHEKYYIKYHGLSDSIKIEYEVNHDES